MQNASVRADPASAGEHIWLVLQRDLSVWLRGLRDPTFATMVLDITDRGTRAVEAGPTSAESFKETLRLAATQPSNRMTPRVPDRLQVQIGMAGALRAVLGDLAREAGFRPDCIVEEIVPEEGAESVFDDLIAQMAGRRPAAERLQSADAVLLYEHARRFMEAAPWTRWTSDDAFLVELKIGSQRMEGIVVVLGNQLAQPGLLLMPGRERATTLMTSSNAMPPGSLVTQLEGSEGQPDLFLRARRYGWPAEAAVTPNFISVRDDGLQELDRRESWPMALLLAGVVAHFERGNVNETWGSVDLPTGRRGRYHVRPAPEPTEPAPTGGVLLGVQVSNDLMPHDSEVQIGILSPEHLRELRRHADIVVPPKVPFPSGVSPIPLIVMTPSNRDYTGVVARIKRAQPLGATVIERGSGPMLTIMGERAGFVIATDQPSAKVWKRNIRQSDGAHVLIVTDGVVNRETPDPDRPGAGEVGRVYGLFECVLRGGSINAIER
jgi:hypothetical protein